MAFDAEGPKPAQLPGYRPSPGLRLLDWGESSAVVYLPRRSSTHLIDGEVAAALAAWAGVAARAADEPRHPQELPPALADHLSALLMSGIIEAAGEAWSTTSVAVPRTAPPSAPQSGA
jgi:hypothetical protein